jgi:hypothetical protein
MPKQQPSQAGSKTIIRSMRLPIDLVERMDRVMPPRADHIGLSDVASRNRQIVALLYKWVEEKEKTLYR